MYVIWPVYISVTFTYRLVRGFFGDDFGEAKMASFPDTHPGVFGLSGNL